MTDKQSNSLDMFLVVNQFYLANQAQLDLVPALGIGFGQLQTKTTAINSNISSQSSSTKGVTQDKAALRANLDELSFSILAPARAWAVAAGNNTLAEQFHVSQSELNYLKDDTVGAFCQLRLQLVDDNIAAMADYGLTPALVLTWQTAIDDFNAAIGNPRTAIVSRSQSTTNLRQLFKETRTLFTLTLDPLMVPFRTSDPELYETYKKSRIIIDRGSSAPKNPEPPVKPTTADFSGTVTDMNTLIPVVEALLTLVPDDPSAEPIQFITDSEGKFHRSKIPPTNYLLAVVHPGYDLFEEYVTLVAGESLVLDIMLLPEMP